MSGNGRWILNTVLVAAMSAGWVGWRARPLPEVPLGIPCIRGVNRYGDTGSMRIQVPSEQRRQEIDLWLDSRAVSRDLVRESPDGKCLAFYSRMPQERLWALYAMEKTTGSTALVTTMASSDDTPGLPVWRGNDLYTGVQSTGRLGYYGVESGKRHEEEFSAAGFAARPLGCALAVFAAGFVASRLGRNRKAVRSFFQREGWGYVASIASLVGMEAELREVESLAGLPFRSLASLLPFGVLPIIVNYSAMTANDLYRLFQPPFLRNLGRFLAGVVNPARRSEAQYALFYGSEWKAMDEALVKQDVNCALLHLPGVLARLEHDNDETGFIGRFAPAIGKSAHAAVIRDIPSYGRSLFEAFHHIIKQNPGGVFKNLDEFVRLVPSGNSPAARIAAGFVLDYLSRKSSSENDRIVCERKALDWYEAGVRALVESERFGALPFHAAFRKEVGEGLRNDYLQATMISKRVPENQAGTLIMEHHLLSEYHRRLPGLVPRPLAFLPRKGGKAYLFELRMGFETLFDVFASQTKSKQDALLEIGVRQLALIHRVSPWTLLENASKENPHFYAKWLADRTDPIGALYPGAQGFLEMLKRGCAGIDKVLRALPLGYYKDTCHWNSVMNPHLSVGGPPFFPVDFELRQESGVMPVVIDLATFVCFDGVPLDLERERELCEMYRQEIPSCGKVQSDLFWQGSCAGAAYRLPGMAGYRILDFGRTNDLKKRRAGILHLQNAIEHAKLLPRAIIPGEYLAGLEGVLRVCDK